jgi:hypothetical protein
MSSWPTSDPRGLLAEVNAEDRDRMVDLASRMRAERGTIDACRRFADAVTKPLVGDGFDTPPLDREGAEAVVDVVSTHPALADQRDVPFASAVLGVPSADPAEFDARREAAEFLAVGLWAFGNQGEIDKHVADALVTTAIGGDAFSRLVRDIVLGGRRGLDLDWDGLIPLRLIDLEELDRRACVRSIQDAALGLGLESRPGRAWATGITAISPRRACPGDEVVIRGPGFGANKPVGVVVVFPNRSGGCVEARVKKWSDKAITVVVPNSVGSGCVGFAEPGSAPSAEATSTFAGELERCIGPAAFPVADKIRTRGQVAPTPCPGCLKGGANRFDGGGPVIETFTVNFGHDVVVQPGDHVVLRWRVRGAQNLSLTRTSPNGPFFAPAPGPLPPLPASGTWDLGPFIAFSPTWASYALNASNGCGSETWTVDVRVMQAPKLSVAAIEVVQVIQRPNNSVRLVSRKRTVARVFVDSGVTNDFDYGSGPNAVPGIVGDVLVYPAGRGYGTSGVPLNFASALAVPAASRNRNNPDHSFTVELPRDELDGPVRLEARIAVAGHENDVGGPWKASGSTSVVFNPQPRQEVLPFLVADSVWGLPAPSLGNFNAALQESRKRYPVAELGWTVNPAITRATTWSPGANYDLTQVIGWVFLHNDLQTMIFVFPSTPVGGIRTAIVPRNNGLLTDAAGNPIPRYAVSGMASPRIGGFAPVSISQARLTGTYAHEMGHTFGLGHAPCPPPPGTPGSGDCMDPPDGIDPTLPGMTDEVGFDVPAGTVIELGRGELMSYCGDSSRCPGATRWPSIATWDLLFNTVPVS